MFDPATLTPGTPVLIAGPTASGKSAMAAVIARRLGGMVVNADALQVYDCWRVLTARPTPAEESALPHRLYGHVSCDTAYSVGDWLRELGTLLDREPDRTPVIVGGTGLYFTALTEGLAEIPPVPAEIRARAEARIAAAGIAALRAELAARDPATHDRIDRQNPVRVQRAWEVLEATGRGLAAWQDGTGPPLLPLSRCRAFVLEAPKDWLTPRIAARFGQMIAGGALDEARARRPRWDPAQPSARAIGAPELMAYLDGEMRLEEAEAAAVVATRQYAKRQRSWFRAKMKDWTWLPAQEAAALR